LMIFALASNKANFFASKRISFTFGYLVL